STRSSSTSPTSTASSASPTAAPPCATPTRTTSPVPRARCRPSRPDPPRRSAPAELASGRGPRGLVRLGERHPALECDGDHGRPAGPAVDPALSSEQAHALMHDHESQVPAARRLHERGLQVEAASVIGHLRLYAL